MEHFLHMKIVVHDSDALYCKAELASPAIPNMRQNYEGDSYSEIFQQVLEQFGHLITTPTSTLIIDFEVV